MDEYTFFYLSPSGSNSRESDGQRPLKTVPQALSANSSWLPSPRCHLPRLVKHFPSFPPFLTSHVFMEHTERGDCSNVRALFVRMACALLFAKWSFRGIASQALSASKRHTAEKESCFFVDFFSFFSNLF